MRRMFCLMPKSYATTCSFRLVFDSRQAAADRPPDCADRTRQSCTPPWSKPRAPGPSRPSCGLPAPSGPARRIGLRRRNHAAHHAIGPQVPHQRARIDLGQHRNRIPLHVLVGHLFRAPVGADGRELADDQALDIGLGRFVVCLVGAVVADLGIGENDDLPGIGRIGGDFLITGKGSIKNDFALAFARVPIAVARKMRPSSSARIACIASPRSGFNRF